MRNQKPPFETTNQMIDYVAEILREPQGLQLSINADVRELCEVSTAMANRILSNLVEKGTIIRDRKKSHWVYKLGE